MNDNPVDPDGLRTIDDRGVDGWFVACLVGGLLAVNLGTIAAAVNGDVAWLALTAFGAALVLTAVVRLARARTQTLRELRADLRPIPSERPEPTNPIERAAVRPGAIAWAGLVVALVVAVSVRDVDGAGRIMVSMWSGGLTAAGVALARPRTHRFLDAPRAALAGILVLALVTSGMGGFGDEPILPGASAASILVAVILAAGTILDLLRPKRAPLRLDQS